MTIPPKVSVIVPMRNAAPFIAATLESLCNQQTQQSYEILVVNDASTDGCDDIVRNWPDPRVRMVEGGGHGEALAVNTAVEHSRGEIIMRCDADDLWPADRLEWQADFLCTHPEFGAVGGIMWTTDLEGQIRVPLGTEEPAGVEITNELLKGKTRTSLCTFAFHKECFLKVGGCRPFFLTSPDIDLQFRLAQECRVWFEPRCCYVYRLHDASVTHVQSNTRREFFENTAILFAKQRKECGLDDLTRGKPPAIPAEFGGSASVSEALVGQLMGACWRAHASGQRVEAFKLALIAWRKSGWKRRYLFNLFSVVFKPTAVDEQKAR